MISRKSSHRNYPAFALIIALSLMSFIVLLTLTMSAMLKNQIEESSTNLETNSARNNAMLGLQIALGDLQRYAGPDQRTTATADILATTTNDEQNHYTGVWNSADPDPDNVALTDPVTGLNKGGFMRWLVSQPINAAIPESLPASTTYPLGKVALVIDQDSSTKTVEVEKISAPNTLGNGNYAYWVGDDGVKAKANLPIKDKNISYGITFDGYRDGSQVLLASPRYGIEHFDTTEYAQYKESLSTLDATRLDFQDLMKKIVSKDQVQLIDTTSNKFDKLNDTYYHDFTTHSMGLLTNTKDGGLKEDLSLAFEHGTKGSLDSPVLPAGHMGKQSGDDRFVYTVQNYLHPRGNAATTGAGLIRVRGPRWDILQEHYNLHKTLKTYAVTDTQPILNSQFGNPHGLINDDVTQQSQLFNDSIAAPDWRNDWRVFYRLFGSTRDPAVLNVHYAGNYTYSPLEIARPHATRLNPVPLIMSHAYSLYSPDGTTLQLIGNPMILLWNPYNIRLKFDVNDADVLDPAFGIKEYINFQFKGTLSAQTPMTGKGDYMAQHSFVMLNSMPHHNGSTLMRIPKALLDFQPGELKLYSADNDATDTTDPWRHHNGKVAQLGYNPKGGWIFDELDPTAGGQPLTCTGNFRVIMESSGARDAMFRVNGNQSQMEQFYSRTQASGNGGIWNYNTDESIVHNIALLAAQNIFPIADFFNRTMASDDLDASSTLLNPVVRPPEVWMFSNPRYLYASGKTGTVYGDRPLSVMQSVEELDGTGILSFGLSGPNGFFGASYSASGGYKQMASWDIPRSPLLSIAQLQHAHTQTWYWEPSYPTGNSYASPYLKRDETISTNDADFSSVDISYLMNETLWDGYYFSSLSPRYETSSYTAPVTNFYDEKDDLDTVIDEFSQSNSINNTLRNPRMTFYRSENKTDAEIATLLKIDDPNAGEMYGSKSAPAFMMLDGGFNINSTSINAWKALLSGLNEINVPVLNTDLDSTTDTVDYSEANKNVFSRFALPLDTQGDSNGLTDVDPANDHWEGFRSLSDQHITDLATNIVAEIKARGPSFTLADFINRKLTTTGDHWKSGPLQSAIDTTNVVSIGGGVGTGINGDMLLQYPETVTKLKTNAWIVRRLMEPYTKTGYTDGIGTLDTDLEGFTVGGANGYLMQADILNSIGPFLNNRSHTFTIRTYGDSTDINGTVTSKAYLEAIVQQVTEFVDPTDEANEYFEPDPTDLTKYLPDVTYPALNRLKISTINQTFGRKFKIVSYRWLNESDL